MQWFILGLENHVMTMACASYTPVSDKLIPTGEIATVEGTVFDLRNPTRYLIVYQNKSC